MTSSFVVTEGCPGREITSTTQYVAYFQIEVQRAVLFLSAELSIVLFDASNNIIRAFPMSISCADSITCLGKQWTGSDEDIVEIVATKLNLTYTKS